MRKNDDTAPICRAENFALKTSSGTPLAFFAAFENVCSSGSDRTHLEPQNKQTRLGSIKVLVWDYWKKLHSIVDYRFPARINSRNGRVSNQLTAFLSKIAKGLHSAGAEQIFSKTSTWTGLNHNEVNLQHDAMVASQCPHTAKAIASLLQSQATKGLFTNLADLLCCRNSLCNHLLFIRLAEAYRFYFVVTMMQAE